MTEHYQIGDAIEATVKVRRGPGWDVKPEGNCIDGQRVRLQYAWPIEEGDHSAYQGETAWMPLNRDLMEGRWPRNWPAWLASGDLVDIEPIRD